MAERHDALAGRGRADPGGRGCRARRAAADGRDRGDDRDRPRRDQRDPGPCAARDRCARDLGAVTRRASSAAIRADAAVDRRATRQSTSRSSWSAPASRWSSTVPSRTPRCTPPKRRGFAATETWSGSGHDAQHLAALFGTLLVFVPLERRREPYARRGRRRLGHRARLAGGQRRALLPVVFRSN